MGATSEDERRRQNEWRTAFEIIEEFFVVSVVQRFKSLGDT